ncbi:hypothetical protein PMIN06_000209 [Paraphaeosphaeria minitans]
MLMGLGSGSRTMVSYSTSMRLRLWLERRVLISMRRGIFRVKRTGQTFTTLANTPSQCIPPPLTSHRLPPRTFYHEERVTTEMHHSTFSHATNKMCASSAIFIPTLNLLHLISTKYPFQSTHTTSLNVRDKWTASPARVSTNEKIYLPQ